jgi:hypothetical protein
MGACEDLRQEQDRAGEIESLGLYYLVPTTISDLGIDYLLIVKLYFIMITLLSVGNVVPIA